MELITQDIHEPRLRYPGRKGIYPVIVDFDDVFRRLNVAPVLANDIDLTTPEGKAKFNSLVFTSYDGDVFSNVPACPCRATIGGIKINQKCKVCGFEVLPITEQNIEPIVWVRVPDEIPAFLNINVYRLLKNRFTHASFSAIDYLIDPKYRPPKLNSAEETAIRNITEKRGLIHFYHNFDKIMDGLCASRLFVTPAKAATTKRFIEIHRKVIFCKYLPFPSKIGFVVENVGERTYVDPKMAPALSALISLARVTSEGRAAVRNMETCVARSFAKLTEYHSSTERVTIFEKKGVSRRLVYGVSPHFSFRTVITSNHKPHDHESLEIPWVSAVLMFKLHLANKLLKQNYTPNEIFTLIYDNVLRESPLLGQLFDELIAESPEGRGIPCLFTRFPSLKRGSTQCFYIDKIKRDPTQLSTSISVLCLIAPNADFDGDYMSGQIALDNRQAKAYKRMLPSTGYMDLKRPFRVSNHSSQPTPILSMINHRLEVGDELSQPVED